MKTGIILLHSCILAVLVLPLIGIGSGASAQNILTNPGFESGDLTGWVVAGSNSVATVAVQSPDNGPALPGTHNAFLENHGEALGLTLKQTTAPGSAAGGQVDYSFDLKLDQADVGGVLFAEIFAEKEGVGIVGGSGLMGPFWPWNAWATFTGSFASPAGTDFMTIQFVAVTGAAIGTSCVAHVDNVSLEVQSIIANEVTSWGDMKALFR
jgi:hypothetical protein